MMLTPLVSGTVLSTDIAVTTIDQTCDRVVRLARAQQPAYVCFATAHMIVEACRDSTISAAYAGATLVNPDGTPVSWCLRALGHRSAQTVNGPRSMPHILLAAEKNEISVGFYGGRPETLRLLREALTREYPQLNVAYCYSPPFRPLSPSEQEEHLAHIRHSGAQMLFVGLGSPKQERWMHQFSPSLNMVCLGVGAAFEFLAGEKVFPPVWIQQLGLTWLVRLCQEPRRLAKRNLYSPIFAAMFLKQYLLTRMQRPDPHRPLRRNELSKGSAE